MISHLGDPSWNVDVYDLIFSDSLKSLAAPLLTELGVP